MQAFLAVLVFLSIFKFLIDFSLLQHPEAVPQPKCRKEPGFVWLRVQKTASTTLEASFKELVAAKGWKSSGGTTQSRCIDLLAADYHPRLSQHVSWRSCAFHVLNRPAYAFMVFRKPWERLISAFCHDGGRGIAYGVAERHANINTRCHEAAQRNLSTYIRECPEAVDNVYLQHLDPINSNMAVARERLRRTNVGLSSDMQRTVEFLSKLFKMKVKLPGNLNERESHASCARRIDVYRSNPLVQRVLKDDIELYELAKTQAYKRKAAICPKFSKNL